MQELWDDINRQLETLGYDPKTGQMKPNNGYPTLPDFMSILGGDGNLQDKYKLTARPDLLTRVEEMLGRSRGAIDKLNEYATGPTGSSPWAKAQMDMLKLRSGKAMGEVGAQVNAGVRAAGNAAASRGGLSEATRKVLARNAMNQTINAKQGITGQRLQGEAGIMSDDAGRQLQILQSIPGMENATTSLWAQTADRDRSYNTDVDKTNLATLLGGVKGQNDWNMSKYENQIKQQAGHEMALAQANSGKK